MLMIRMSKIIIPPSIPKTSPSPCIVSVQRKNTNLRYLYLPILIFFETTCLDEKRIMHFEAKKSFLYIQTALQYKQLYNINRSEKWGKKNKNRGL